MNSLKKARTVEAAEEESMDRPRSMSRAGVPHSPDLSLEQCRAFADTVPAMLWMTEASGGCFISRACREFTGCAKAPDSWLELFHPADRERISRLVSSTGEHGEFAVECLLQHAGGGYRMVLNTGRACRDADGRVSAYVGSFVDISEKKRAEQALRETDQRRDEFLATLAHELRNPLAPLRNGLQLMQLAGDNAEAVTEARRMMERQVEHMVRLIDDLLDVSRINVGKIELRKEWADLSAVLHAAIETARPLMERAGQQFTLEMPPEPIYLNADIVRLSQVFANLLDNAAKYSRSGGRIRMRVARDEGHALVSVIDEGVGIDAQTLPKVFDIFTQGQHAHEKAQTGLGIGLTIVKRLVEMHDGTVEARSLGAGQGSEFVVRLPALAAQATSDSITAATDKSSDPQSKRILIADDNVDSASSLAMMLELMGHEVRSAYDGAAAVEAAEAFRPEIILLDIGMPKLNGYDACRQILEQSWSESALLVALTGWGQDEDKARAREAGFHHHLVKPVALKSLLAVFADAGKTGAARS